MVGFGLAWFGLAYATGRLSLRSFAPLKSGFAQDDSVVLGNGSAGDDGVVKWPDLKMTAWCRRTDAELNMQPERRGEATKIKLTNLIRSSEEITG